MNTEDRNLASIGADHLVYVVPADGRRVPADGDGDIDLIQVWNVIWSNRWLVIALVATSMILATGYILTAAKWYRAEVLLVPADQRATQGLSGQLSGMGGLGALASLAGINAGAADSVEPIAVLTSRDFVRAFIEQQNLIPVLFSNKWDREHNRWKAKDPKDWPDTQDAVKFFNAKVLRVREDKKTKLVTLSIEWTNASVAATWAKLLVERLNTRMRQRTLEEAESNIAYLKKELQAGDVVTLQQSLGRILENELQKAMLARGSTEFAFRTIDSAEASKWRSRPQRVQTLILALALGTVFAMIVVFARRAIQQHGNRSTVPISEPVE